MPRVKSGNPSPPRRRARAGRMLLMMPALLAMLAPVTGVAAAERTGQQIYAQQCASCHGDKGQGVKGEYSEPLIGERSLTSLGKYIDKWMPEDDPAKCVGEEAQKVAKYIFDAFYSPIAQARIAPPRIALSRLTARQYGQAVADLIGTFSKPGNWDEQRGLRAEFFNSGRRIRDERRAHERIDPVLSFNFGEDRPHESVKRDEYAGRWSGGVLAQETGEYEFVLETENGAALWVNDDEQALIDAWVRSGDHKNHRASIYLLGGRVYPLRVEFFKEKKEKTATIALRWKPPHRVEELVPQQALSPNDFPPLLVVQTPFPPEDRSMGYERGTLLSKAWDEATTYGAVEVAGHVAARVEQLTGTTAGDGEAKQKFERFAQRFVERAFRRPLSDERRHFFVARHFEGGADPQLALKKAVLLALKSPRFLYHQASSAQFDAYDVASRISFALWDTLPDEPLLEAARNGQLATREQLAAQIERMLPDLRSRAKMREFYEQWLHLDRMHELSKDAKRYPDFSAAIISDLRVSLDMLLDEATWGEKSDYRQLLTANTVYMNGRLAAFYSFDLPGDAPFQKAALDKHAGVLTHPLLMAGFAYDATSSPIHRGVFVARSLLGRRLRPPPEAVVPVSPELHPDLTTRQRIAMQTSSNACMSCHTMINPLGFTFENFDAVGRFRSEESGKPIDATGHYQTADGETVRFASAAELGQFLARSEEAQAAFIERLFQHVFKQPMLAYGLDTPAKFREGFVREEFSIRRLLVEMIATSAVVPRQQQAREEGQQPRQQQANQQQQ